MDFKGLDEFKKYTICQEVGISKEMFPRIIAFVDFANVDHWFDGDLYNLDGKVLSAGQRVVIDIEKLKNFLYCFSEDVRFYYGHDPENIGSLAFNSAAKHIFGQYRVFTKRIQKIRHNLTPEDSVRNTRAIYSDDQGDYVLIPKCNFDVEIAIDALRLMKNYDTICLLSSDADFGALMRHLRNKQNNKKTILIKGGRIDHSLGEALDLKIDASQIKYCVSKIK